MLGVLYMSDNQGQKLNFLGGLQKSPKLDKGLKAKGL